MATHDCEVCHETVSKYRCPKCEARSCSLPCFKSHQTSCAETTPSENKTVNDTRHSAELTPPKMSAREELNQLFQQYPQLRGKLRAIYLETLDPKLKPGTVDRPRNSRSGPRWTEQKGFEDGLRVLKAKLGSDSADQEDVRAFAAYVSGISDEN